MATLEKGPLCYTRLLGKRIYFVNEAEYVKRILLDKLANYPKSVTIPQQPAALPRRRLLISEGDFWKRQRSLAQPAFHLRRLKALAGDRWPSCAGRMAQGWQHGEIIDRDPRNERRDHGNRRADAVRRRRDKPTSARRRIHARAGRGNRGRIRPPAFFDLPNSSPAPRPGASPQAVGALDRIVEPHGGPTRAPKWTRAPRRATTCSR
jgi:hypothetical protein